MKKNEKAVFALLAYSVPFVYDSEKDEYIPPQYPEFDLSESEIGFYTSLENAEAGMQRHIAGLNVRDKKHERLQLYCFTITEYSMNKILEEWQEIDSKRTYSSGGQLVDACLTAEINITSRLLTLLGGGQLVDACLTAERDIWYETVRCRTVEEYQRKGMFPGRRPEDIRFKEGDIVEVFGEFRMWNTVNLGIVAGTPPTLQEAQEWDKPYDEEALAAECRWHGDYSDDKYTILTGDNVYNFREGDDAEYCYESWSNGTYIFPARLPVPETLRKSLTMALHDFLWHPVVRPYIQQIDDMQQRETIENCYRLGKKMDRQRMKELLEDMKMPYNGTPKNPDAIDCGIPDKEMPAYCLKKIEEYKDDEERCAAICFGLKIYFDGVEWKRTKS
jgi:hypothetical protein